MPPKQPPALQTIDPTALAQVAGGARRSASTDSGTSTGSDGSAVVTALTGILDSLKDLSRSRSSGGMTAQDLVLIMMMMQQRQQPVVVAPATTWPFPPAIR